MTIPTIVRLSPILRVIPGTAVTGLLPMGSLRKWPVSLELELEEEFVSLPLFDAVSFGPPQLNGHQLAMV